MCFFVVSLLYVLLKPCDITVNITLDVDRDRRLNWLLYYQTLDRWHDLRLTVYVVLVLADGKQLLRAISIVSTARDMREVAP